MLLPVHDVEHRRGHCVHHHICLRKYIQWIQLISHQFQFRFFFIIIISKLTVSMGKILTGYVLCYIVVYKSAQTTAALSARQYQYYLLFIISTDFFLSVFFFLLGLRERPTDLPDLYSFIFR